MRLHQAGTLREYITQLKKDLPILEAHAVNAENYNRELHNLWTDHRDTAENHSDILSKHRDQLRQKINKLRQENTCVK